MRRWLLWGGGIVVSAVGYFFLFQTARTDTVALLGLWGTLFLLYGIAIHYQTTFQFKILLGAAVVFRLLGMLHLPLLSDDVYRFIWDGRLLAQGYNPFLYLPKEILASGITTQAGLTEVLFQKLNSPDYYTVYPPLLQGWFAVAATLGTSEIATVFWLRLPIFLGEIATIWLLYQILKLLGKDEAATRRGVLLYALNPLVIVELTGNLHYEGLTICFLLAGLFFYLKQKQTSSATFLALAAGVKLLPLIFIPALLDRNDWKKSLKYLLTAGVVFGLPFLFFLDKAIIENFSTSLDLYFRSFEFNASLYYLLRELGTWVMGYNPIATIGPLLALVSVSLILFFSWSEKLKINLPERWLWVLTVYLLCATTVHPWYVVPLVALGTLTRFRFPVVWSVVLPLTYVAYGQMPFQENLWLVAVEYLVVFGWMMWEILRYKSAD
ncbi:glycosyltransferase family 87 protein [Persicitalea sp.]|uniref:glycosyltransferase family 87 protein n=1 Tax=Persicitalea sp. TaxID=3100273 RepID=UPI0035939FDE